MYELAAEDDQRYKEAKVILEKALVREKDGIQELDVTNWQLYHKYSAQSINSPLGNAKSYVESSNLDLFQTIWLFNANFGMSKYQHLKRTA